MKIKIFKVISMLVLSLSSFSVFAQNNEQSQSPKDWTYVEVYGENHLPVNAVEISFQVSGGYIPPYIAARTIHPIKLGHFRLKPGPVIYFTNFAVRPSITVNCGVIPEGQKVHLLVIKAYWDGDYKCEMRIK